MGKIDLDGLVKQAARMPVGTPRDQVRRVRATLRSEARRLQGAIAEHLVGAAGFAPTASSEERARRADELAAAVTQGRIRWSDKQLAPASTAAAQLRVVLHRIVRLQRLLTVLPQFPAATFVESFDERPSGYVRKQEAWMSPAGSFLVQHVVLGGLLDEKRRPRWQALAFATDEDGTMLADGCSLGGLARFDAPVSRKAIGQALDGLTFDGVVDWLADPARQ
jgi:hypothetical protein